MSLYLSIGQIITAVVLIISILLQARGSGLSGAFGGEGAVYRTRRGIEKSLFIVTIVTTVLFFALSLLNIIVR